MENTLENKAKFFALYWGQKIIASEKFNSDSRYLIDGCKIIDYEYLELKPLSSISGEEAKQVARLEGFIERLFASGIMVIDTYAGIEDRMPASIVDYLRSRGYALPYMGITVEQQIEYGWVKLV